MHAVDKSFKDMDLSTVFFMYGIYFLFRTVLHIQTEYDIFAVTNRLVNQIC